MLDDDDIKKYIDPLPEDQRKLLDESWLPKWPDAAEVYKDWAVIIEQFPFLELDVVLYNAEHSEYHAQPVIGFKIRDGKIVVKDGTANDFFIDFDENFVRKESPLSQAALLACVLQSPMQREVGLSRDVIREWGALMTGRLDQYPLPEKIEPSE